MSDSQQVTEEAIVRAAFVGTLIGLEPYENWAYLRSHSPIVVAYELEQAELEASK